MPHESEGRCPVCGAHLEEDNRCPNPHCKTYRVCPRCGAHLDASGVCEDAECGTNRPTFLPSERAGRTSPSGVSTSGASPSEIAGGYTTKPPRKQSFPEMVALRHPMPEGELYDLARERGRMPVLPAVSGTEPGSEECDDEPPTDREGSEAVRTRSGIEVHEGVEMADDESVQKKR